MDIKMTQINKALGFFFDVIMVIIPLSAVYTVYLTLKGAIL
jgi:hypothetical protein